MGSAVTAPLILNLGNRLCDKQLASHHSRFTPCAGMGHFGEDRKRKKLLVLLTGVEPRSNVCPCPKLVTIPTKRGRKAFMNETFLFFIHLV